MHPPQPQTVNPTMPNALKSNLVVIAALTIMGAVIASPASGSAADLAIEATQRPAPTIVSSVDVDQAFTFSNNTDRAMTLELGGLVNGEAKPKTTWRWTESGVVLNKPVVVPARGKVSLSATAFAPKPGLYQIRVVQRRREGAITTILTIDRRAVAPKIGLLDTPSAPFQVDGQGTAKLDFTVFNPTDNALSLDAPRLKTLSRTIDKQTRTLSMDATGDIICAQGVLQPQSGCKAHIAVPLDGPGAYVAKVRVSGAEGGEGVAEISINVRACWGLAVALALAGSVIGWAYTFWREKGRAKVLAMEDVAALRERLGALRREARDLGAGAAFRVALEKLNELSALLRRLDGDDRTTDRTSLAKRIDRIEQWLALAAAAARLTPSSDIVNEASSAVDKLLSDPKDADKDVEAALATLKAAIDSAQGSQATPLNGLMMADVPTPSALDVDIPWPWRRDASANQIGKWRQRIDLVANSVFTVVIVLATVQWVWAPNLTWGGMTDMLGLGLSSFAIHASGSEVLTRVRSAYGV